MPLSKLIEAQFFRFFTANTEAEALAALNKLLELGVSEDRINEGVKAGLEFIKNQSGILKEIQIKKRRVA
jgi:hypothetical protein